MFSPLDAAGLVSVPEGVAPGSDLSAMVMGRLVGVDPEARAVQVTVLGSDPVWVAAMPAIYTPGGMVRLLRSPLDGGKITLCMMPMDQVLPVARGTVVEIDAPTSTMTVDTLGGAHVLGYAPGTYEVGGTVHVLRDPWSFGAPYRVAGPEGNFAGVDPGGGSEGAVNPPVVESRQVTVGPQWSGSYGSGRWDNWNVYQGSYGGRAALYQGQGYGSPVMQGLAVYGDQIVNLGAQTITKMTLRFERPPSGSGTGTGPAVFRPSPHGGAAPGGGPAAFGDTASVNITRGTSTSLDLPAGMHEAFRTGAAKGLAMVGGNYLNVYGQDRAGSLALTIQYEVAR